MLEGIWRVSVLAPTNVWPSRVKKDKKNGTSQHYHSQRKLLLIPPFLAHSLKLVNKS